MEWHKSTDLQKQVGQIVTSLNFGHINQAKVIVFRSFGSKSKAIARIWGLPRIWQNALNIKPHYCLEVISEKFDKLKSDDQKRVIIHELLHIPKVFSGSLLPHRHLKRRIDRKTVEYYFQKL